MATKLADGRNTFTYPRPPGSQIQAGVRKRPPAKKTNDITELHRLIESLEKDRKLKDDTIYFLQMEKERLQREIRHYEHICESLVEERPAVFSSLAMKKLEEEINNLKGVVKKQSALLQAGTASTTDKKIVSRLSINLISLLQQSSNPITSTLISEIENQLPNFQKPSSRHGDTAWHLIAIVDKALIELRALQESLNNSTLRETTSHADPEQRVRNCMLSDSCLRPATTVPKRSEALVVARQRIKQTQRNFQRGNRCRSALESENAYPRNRPVLRLTRRTSPFRSIQSPSTCIIELPARSNTVLT